MDKENYKRLINIIIEEYLNTPEKERSLTKLSGKYGVTRKTITKYLKSNGYNIINYQNMCSVDEHIFDTIDTEEKAYWLGFLYADGCISKIGFRLELNIAARDLDHMHKFKKFIKSSAKDRFEVKNKKFSVCRFSVRNKNIWEQLNAKGCIPCKTLVLRFPTKNIFENNNLIRHFIRGYFDGDGTMGLYNGKYGRMFNCSFAGTKEFLEQVEKELGIKGCIRNASCNAYNSKIYTLSYSYLKARKISRILYENSSIYLSRKYNIYKMFCLAEEESSVLKSSKFGEPWDGNTEVCLEITKGSERP